MPVPLPPIGRRALAAIALIPALGCGSGDGAPRPDGGRLPDGGTERDAGADCGQDTPPAPGLVVTDRGPVRGVPSATGDSYAYLGIPFVAPPVGDLRWRPPEDVACWADVLDADTLAPKCPQLERPTRDAPLELVGDEDCLALNVWAPATTPRPLPVMFFIHGGGNTIGSARQMLDDDVLLYDGARFAEPGQAVVVTAQYRLGPLGFLAHDDLSNERDEGVSGNYGILDQIAALEWVQRNIAAFGGDPDRVMVFGESAGAVDTCVHLASPLSEDLFSAALMQSGSCNTSFTLGRRENEGDEYVLAAGCDRDVDVPACLRRLTVEDALFALPTEVTIVGAGGNRWGPNIDGFVLEERPVDAMAAGRSHPVPLVIGSNTEETGRDAPAIPDTDEGYRAAIRALGVGEIGADLIMAEYPRDSFATARQAFIQATTDASFTCPTRAAARAQSDGHPSVPVFRYLFAQRLLGGADVLRAFGAWHGLELLFLFGHLEVGGYVPTDEDVDVAGEIGSRWAAFATFRDPTAGELERWPPYVEPAERILRIGGLAPGALTDPRRDRCDFWEGLGGGR